MEYTEDINACLRDDAVFCGKHFSVNLVDQ